MSIKERKVVQFYDARQRNIDRLVCRLQNFDWSVVMQCTDMIFLAISLLRLYIG